MIIKPRLIFAFDFGMKHIGLAIGQEITNTTHTFYSLEAKAGKPDWKELDVIVENWKPSLFIVGNPLNMDGTNSKIKKKSDEFSSLIFKRYRIPVELTDERLTTKEAEDRMKVESNYIVDKSLDTHSVSAQVILESWFREKG